MNTSNQQKLVQTRRLRRQRRVRNRMSGTLERPRLAVFRSSKHIYAQMVNDQTGTTLVSASTLDPEVRAAQVRRQQSRRDLCRPCGRRASQKGRY